MSNRMIGMSISRGSLFDEQYDWFNHETAKSRSKNILIRCLTNSRCNLVGSYAPKDWATFFTLLGISILLNFLMFYNKLSIQTNNEKVDVLTCQKCTLQRVKNIFSGRKANQWKQILSSFFNQKILLMHWNVYF